MSARAPSIRTRLALWYALAVAAAVVVYGAVVYVSSRSALLEQLDARLHDDFERAEHAIVRSGELDPLTHDSGWAEVVRGDGSVLVRPEPSAMGEPPYRTYEATYRVEDGTEYRIRVGRSEAGVRHELRELLLLLAASLVPVAGLAFLLGRWLAGRTLAPVEAMTSRAREIGADRLSERLAAPNPGDEIGRLAAAFNETFARIERTFEQLRRFTSDASHELRTPLAALRAVGEVGLRNARTVEDLRGVVESMLEECVRLARLVEDLLTLSRGDAGGVALRPETFALGDLARDVTTQLGVLAEERAQRLVVADGAPVVVRADRRLLGMAVTNLVDNAIRYAPSGSVVRLVPSSAGAAPVLAVEDEGPGIAAEHRARVFERFYRVDPSRTEGGVGLGLSIARWAVKAHGGRIELDSEVGRGSTFRIVLPAASAAAS